MRSRGDALAVRTPGDGGHPTVVPLQGLERRIEAQPEVVPFPVSKELGAACVETKGISGVAECLRASRCVEIRRVGAPLEGFRLLGQFLVAGSQCCGILLGDFCIPLGLCGRLLQFAVLVPDPDEPDRHDEE